MSTVTVTGLNVIAVFVTDLAASEAFYRDRFGFEKTADMEPGILMRAGDVTLYMEPGRAPKASGSTRTAECAPCFAVESVRSAWEALVAADVEVVCAYQEFSPEFGFFQVADPDGNLIEFAGKP
jgi:catechol 2,3-dioxygenase-like lactoylglutathione lyase family enzyme